MSTPRTALPPVPNDAAQAHLARGRELHRAGRALEAIAAFDAAVAARPADAMAQSAAGVANLQLGRLARGVAHLRVAVAADPGLATAWANLAHGLREMGRPEPAREAVERAVALDSGLAMAWNLLGIVLQDLGRLEEAQPQFRRALERDPRFTLALVNLANGEQTLGRHESAEREYRRALAMDANVPELHYNFGHLFHKTGREREAIPHYRRALELRPDYHLARNNLGHVLFLIGQFGDAWREYGGRANRVQHLDLRARAGAPYRLPTHAQLRGARVVALGEQGLGDILFFLRFVPGLARAGATIEFAGEPRLHGMLARTGLFAHVGASPSPGEGYAVLAGDLALLQEDPGALAPPLPLVPDPARIAKMRERLAMSGPGPYLAVAWRAGIAKIELTETLHKEIPLDEFGRALAGLPGTLVSVQREPGAGETAALAQAAGRKVLDLATVNEDLEDALAAMAAVDEYVGVSSTNVHLRASTGGGGRILVPHPPEWRWMAARESPWFPAFTTYRQQRGEGWRPALERLAHDLRARAPFSP